MNVLRRSGVGNSTRHPLREQVAGDDVEVGLFILEMRQNGKDPSGSTCLAPARPPGADGIIDTAIAPESLFEMEPAGPE
jgi:hypothetical protein